MGLDSSAAENAVRTDVPAFVRDEPPSAIRDNVANRIRLRFRCLSAVEPLADGSDAHPQRFIEASTYV
jgi:hypothetical protein